METWTHRNKRIALQDCIVIVFSIKKRYCIMKKQFAAIFAATAVLGVTTAFAANPFSDVTPDSWAYQAVSQLAAAGIVNGYPDGTFKGQNDITRYEMAQMVAKAMANQDRANAEQQAMINQDAEHSKSTFDARARLQFNAKVNDRTDAVVRVVAGDFEFGNATTDTTVKFDRAYVNHKFGERVSVKAGRFGQMLGAGLAYDDTFDGAQFNAGNDKVNFQAAYGYAIEGVSNVNTKTNSQLAVVGLNGKLGKHVNAGGFYARVNGEDLKASVAAKPYKNIYGFNTDINFDKVWVGGEWLKASNIEKSQAWVAGVGYGAYDQAKQGTWDVKAQYFNQKANAPILSSTWDHAYTAGYKGWMATADYALQDNVGLTAYYGFNWKDQAGVDQNDFYRVDLNYQF